MKKGLKLLCLAGAVLLIFACSQPTSTNGGNADPTIPQDPTTPQDPEVTLFGGGTGTELDPYIIRTVAHFEELRDKVNSGTAYENSFFSIQENVNFTGVTWTPIGIHIDYLTGYQFSGTLNGNGHIISGLIINAPDTDYLGLFGMTNGATFKNIVFANCSITGDYYCGLLVGKATNTTFESCTNNSNLSLMGRYNGAICGTAKSSSFTNCTNNGDITVYNDDIGGICGSSEYSGNSTFSGCVNNGDFFCSNSSYSGGIVGSGTAIINQCENHGSFTALTDGDDKPKRVGGIAGSATSISHCVNYGNISGFNSSGGVASGAATAEYCNNEGNISDAEQSGGVFSSAETASHCINYGTVSGGYYLGGVMGAGPGSVITDSHNFGAVSGTYYIGGITSSINGSSGSILECTNSADVSGVYNVGGICGLARAGCIISHCVNTGNIFASETDFADRGAAGICSLLERSTLINCLNAGAVSGDDIGGIAGDTSYSTITGNINISRIPGSYARPLVKRDYQCTLSNNFFDSQMSPVINGTHTTDLIIGSSLESVLGTEWIYNDGKYPVPSGVETHDTAILASAPIFFDPGDNADSVTQSFTLGTSGGISWSSSNEAVVSISNGTGTVHSTGTATLIATLNNSTRTIQITTDID